MIFDKIFMIIARYGKSLLFLFLSFVSSAYIFCILEFGYNSIIEYRLFLKPELVVQYFFNSLKKFYYARDQISISIIWKLLIILIAPYIFIRFLSFIINILFFVFAVKIKNKWPNVSGYFLSKINQRSPGILNGFIGSIMSKKSQNTQLQDKPVNNMNTDKPRNLRK